MKQMSFLASEAFGKIFFCALHGMLSSWSAQILYVSTSWSLMN